MESPRNVPCRCETEEMNVSRGMKRYFPLNTRSSFFQHDNVQCSVKVYTDVVPANVKNVQTIKKPTQNPQTCTRKIFQDYFTRKNRFYSDGMWYVPDNSQVEKAVFYPEDCHFDPAPSKPGKLPKCLSRRKYKKILIFGDSNGFRQFNIIKDYFANRSVACDRLRLQGDIPYGKPGPYFNVPGSPTMATFKGCWECRSQVIECRGVDVDQRLTDEDHNASKITLEYIGMGCFLHRNRPIFPKKGPLMENKVLEDTTVMEFLMQKYLPYTGYPDLWIFAAPIHHEAADSNVTNLYRDLMDLKRIVNEYVPPTTDLVFLTNVRMCSVKSGWFELQKFYNAHNESKNQVMHEMNQLLFDVFREDFLKENGNIHGFLDFGQLTCPVVCYWHFDGAHMVDEWYIVVFEQILSYLCSE